MKLKNIVLTLCFAFLSLSTIFAVYSTVFEESFNVSSVPANWAIQGYVGTSHITTGTAKTNIDLFKNNGGNNYLRLTENTGWNRAWAYYTNATFPIMGKWRMTADIRIGKTNNGDELGAGADGMCFVFLNASTVETGGAFDISKAEGGYGEFEGAPRGSLPNQPVTGSKGYHSGLLGFSLEHDHYNNSGELFREYIHWVDLEGWIHSGLGQDMAGDTGFYYNDGWQRIMVEADAGVLTYYYNWTGSSYSSSLVINANNPTNSLCPVINDFDAYIGVCASTGGESAYHEIRNMKLEVDEETLPVELSSFNAVQHSATSAQINWATQSETGVNGFYIYRSQDNLLTNASIVSPLILATNTATHQSYQFTDEEVFSPGTYYYWLQVQDLDGNSNYNGPVSVLILPEGNQGTPDVQLKNGINSIYPNPFNPATTINYGVKDQADVKFFIYNVRGQMVYSYSENNKAPGNWKLLWNGIDNNGNACSSGVYQVRMQIGNVVDTRTAVLLK